MENQQQNNLNPVGEPANAKSSTAERGVTGAGKLGDYILGILISVVASDILGYIVAIYFSVDELGYLDIANVNRDFKTGLVFNIVHWGGLALISLFAFFGLFFKTRWKYVIRGMLIPALIGIICFALLFGWCYLLMFSSNGR